MEEHRYQSHLLAATHSVLHLMRRFVSNHLPDECRYLVSLSEAYYHVLANAQSPHLGQLFPHAVQGFPPAASKQGYVRALTAIDIIRILWFDGAVPEWINVEVHSANETYTFIKLECCSRVTTDDSLLYHRDEGYPPFHVLSGFLPVGWESVERNGKFDLTKIRR